MSAPEIEGLIEDPAWLNRVKESGDTSPRILAFTVAHEGRSDVQLDGVSTPINWIRSAVSWIKNALSTGTPVFHNHGAPGDNSHEGRIPIGQVVGSKLMDVGNRIATVAAMYIYPPYRDAIYDVASIETDIQFEQSGSTVRPLGVAPITGIAIGNSSSSHPGWPGATLLGALQAFAQEGIETMTTEEVKVFLKDQGITPDQVFDRDTILTSDIVKEANAGVRNVYSQTRRVEEENAALKVQMGDMKTTLDSVNSTVEQLSVGNRRSSAATVMATVVTERKLDDRTKAILGLRAPTFTPASTDPTKLRDEVNTFVDGVVTEAKDLATLFGVEAATPPLPGSDTPPVVPPIVPPATPVTPPLVPGQAATPDQMLDSDTNSLIPGGKADTAFGTG